MTQLYRPTYHRYSDISVNSCEIHSTGSLSGSAFTIGSQPLFGGVSLALRLLTYWDFILTSSCTGRQSLRSASRGDFVVPHARIAIKEHRAFSIVGTLFGIVSHLKSALFHGICPARFTSSLKLLFSPGPGLGVPLSSYLEVAIYKFHR